MTVHERPVGATVEWYTPPELFERLGVTFDSDPAPAPLGKGFVPARILLRGQWAGRVWLNPPYGRAGVPLIDRMIAHGNGLMLLPSRTETAVYQRALTAASATCFLRDRLWFIRDDGFRGRSSFGSTLFGFGAWVPEALRAADLGYTMSRDSAVERAA